MCGVLGACGAWSHDPSFEDVLEGLAARGPDGQATWRGDEVVLGHRRLAIIDLHPRSNQPILSASGRFVMAQNGEIYNYRDLQSPPERGDALALVHEPPPATAPRQLRGMFAYGVWDRSQRTMTLVRDRFGIKPMYFARADDAMAFGSTAAAVSQLSGHRVPSRDAIASYLRFGSVLGPGTIYEGVEEVVPGHAVTWSPPGTTVSGPWTDEAAKHDDHPGDPLLVLRGSVEAHLVSDVPVALFLSGGLDSAILASLCAEAGAEATAFTVTFPWQDEAELDNARLTARRYGLRHEIVQADAEVDFEAFFAATDQPSIDGLNTFIVTKAVSEAGFRVALTGLGADEMFGGYSSFRRIPALMLAAKVLPAPLRWAIAARTSSSKARRVVDAGADVVRLHEELRSVFSRSEVVGLLGGPVEWAPPADVSKLPLHEAIATLERDVYMRNTLLRDADVFSMAHSVELRTPFVDAAVLALSRSLGRSRIAFGKRSLARALDDPWLRTLQRQRKRGFTLPFGHWLQHDLADRVSRLEDGPVTSVLEAKGVADAVLAWRGAGRDVSKVWSLVVLDEWLRRNGTGPSA